MLENLSKLFHNQRKVVKNIPDSRNSPKYLSHVIRALAFLVLVCIVSYYNSKNINLKIAYNGYGPQDYVAQKLHPENFTKNWSNSVLNYDHSLPVRVYYYLAKYCGISPSITVYPYMFIQTLLFLLSVAFITQTLFKNKFVTFISVIVISLSNLAGLNLSRFGTGYASYLSFPLFYGYANAFRIFALGFFLRNKYISCSIFLALSIYCHVNMGLFVVAFIGSYLIFKPQLFRDKSILVSMPVFIALVAPHIYTIISSASISSGLVPVDQWVKSTRIFCLHWYPITMKLFTNNAHREFFPFLLLCFFFLVSLKYQDIKDEKNVKIIVGCVACLIMGTVGIVVSDIYPIPFLIKISLQRSTELVTFFGVLYIIYYLFQKINSGKIINVMLAIFSLLIFIFSKPGIAVLPLFLLLFGDIREGCLGPIKIRTDKIRIAEIFYYVATFLLLIVVLTSIFQNKFKFAHSIFAHLWTPFRYFNPFINYDFLLRGGGFKLSFLASYLLTGTILISVCVIFCKNASERTVSKMLIILVVISLSIVWILERDEYKRWHKRYSEIASSYRDVQLWARKNTPVDSLFMPDPSHHYGWRDFSERSSFGNLREWGYCAIAYNPDYKLYQEGLKRMQEFGIDLESIGEEDIINSATFIYGSKLANDIRAMFYAMTAEQLRRISDKYGVDYIVMNKKYHKDKFNELKVDYENENYVIYTFY